MAIRHYVLLATDGFIELPNGPDLCSADTTREYIFGFIGGLYRVVEKGETTYENPNLNWENCDNWESLFMLMGKGTIPSPMIWGEVGDKIYITLINLGMKERPDLMDPHTVHIHGGHVATQLDGFPETSFGVPMWMDSKMKPPAVTYYFKAEHPGTYMYHCHVEASEHVQMGMYGGFVIYPSMKSLALAGITQDCEGMWHLDDKMQHQIPKTATNRNFVYNDINTYFDKEYVMLLSDIDTKWHESVLHPEMLFNAVDFKPNFWLVNGRAFPDTLLPHPLTAPEESNPNLTQINYESYVHVVTNNKFLLRMINMGYQVVPWHIHGWHFTVIGKDAHPSPFLKIAAKLSNMNDKHDDNMHENGHSSPIDHQMQDMGFTATIGSGETFDLLLTADDKSPVYRKYIVKGQDCIDSLCSQLNEIPEDVFDIPTEPVDCANPNTVNYIEICQGLKGVDRFFPQFYPAHNHDDYKVTNNGVYPGGQLIYIQTDAPINSENENNNIDIDTKQEDKIDCDCKK